MDMNNIVSIDAMNVEKFITVQVTSDKATLRRDCCECKVSDALNVFL